MSYGIEIKNKDGDILVDSDHPLPLLHHHAIVNVTLADNNDVFGGYAALVDFEPTNRPVFVTVAVVEGQSPQGIFRLPELVRSTGGAFSRAKIKTMVPAVMEVWVYKL